MTHPQTPPYQINYQCMSVYRKLIFRKQHHFDPARIYMKKLTDITRACPTPLPRQTRIRNQQTIDFKKVETRGGRWSSAGRFLIRHDLQILAINLILQKLLGHSDPWFELVDHRKFWPLHLPVGSLSL